MTKPIRHGMLNGGLTALYIALVITFMQITSRVSVDQSNTSLTGFVVLTLFVVSALITGSLILWMPAQLLVDGKKRDAGMMLAASGGTLVVLLIIVGVIALLVR